MPTSIKIRINDLVLTANLNDSPSAKQFEKMLPLTFAMSRWGDEYYGECNIQLEKSSDAREIMEIGELAIWPPGHALCIFFGPTPASVDDKPRAASAVNPIGRLIDDPSPLRKLGDTIKTHVEINKASC